MDIQERLQLRERRERRKQKRQKTILKFKIISAFITGLIIGAVCMLVFSQNNAFVISFPGNTENTVATENVNLKLPSETPYASENVPEATESPTEKTAATPTELPTATPVQTTAPEKNNVVKANNGSKLIAIDAGHQRKGNSEKEPIAPGASQTKAKVASGTAGVSTNTPEYQVTLDVSLLLEQELLSRGYQVLMIRRTHDVNISNSERAKMANDVDADAFIRIHCNGLDNSSVKGALTMCQTAQNKYCGDLYSQSRALSKSVINNLCAQTGAKNRGVSENDTMSGINWCRVPVTIVEMGFMTNPEEDRLLCDPSYQTKLAKGIADGIDEYFG